VNKEILPPTAVEMYASSTHFRSSQSEAEERRIRHILNSKHIAYDINYIDLNKLHGRQLEELSGNRNTPQLVISLSHALSKQLNELLLASSSIKKKTEVGPNATFERVVYLNYEKLQELEDQGELDTLLLNADRRIRTTASDESSTNGLASSWEDLYYARVR
jgi:hypothetical protein